MGKQHDFDLPLASEELPKCSYIKLINVPSPCDISGTLPDPTDGSLSLTMIDHATLNLVSKFAHRTHLTADLSHSNQSNGNNAVEQNVAVGNYDYDDGSQASMFDDDRANSMDQNHIGVDASGKPYVPNQSIGAGSASQQSLNRRIN